MLPPLGIESLWMVHAAHVTQVLGDTQVLVWLSAIALMRFTVMRMDAVPAIQSPQLDPLR